MTLIEKLNTSYKYACENSQYVKINYEKVDEMIKKIEESKISYWLESNPFDIFDMNLESIINFLLIYHSIGDYCFWGNPKWEIETSLGKLDSSYAIMYLIINRFKEGKTFNMSFKDFKKFLEGNVEIPLLEDRYNNLVQMNQFIEQQNKSFYELIKDFDKDIQLLEFIINNFKYFEDKSKYKGREIYFYKRDQLLTSDILHVMESVGKKKVDYSHLIGCADYKIPQVMRCYGMLEFNDELMEKVDNQIELLENSEEEIEIRANDLEIIDYIYEKLGKRYQKMAINDFIWLLGQDKSNMNKPYHRTLTNHY